MDFNNRTYNLINKDGELLINGFQKNVDIISDTCVRINQNRLIDLNNPNNKISSDELSECRYMIIERAIREEYKISDDVAFFVVRSKDRKECDYNIAYADDKECGLISEDEWFKKIVYNVFFSADNAVTVICGDGRKKCIFLNKKKVSDDFIDNDILFQYFDYAPVHSKIHDGWNWIDKNGEYLWKGKEWFKEVFFDEGEERDIKVCIDKANKYYAIDDSGKLQDYTNILTNF